MHIIYKISFCVNYDNLSLVLIALQQMYSLQLVKMSNITDKLSKKCKQLHNSLYFNNSECTAIIHTVEKI